MSFLQSLVSIVVPVYNGANYLKYAIDSALSQTYGNIEIIVVNDGSDDGGRTERIALSYGNRIRYFHKENGGVASALNFGIMQMRGEYFSWLSHDDMYFPDKIETQIAVAGNEGIVFAGFVVVNSVGLELNRVLPLEKYSREQLETPLFALLHGMISGCSLLIHRSCFERVGTFREDLPTTQDFDLWFRMMRDTPCRVCEGALHMTRVHGEQGSRVHREAQIRESDALWIRIMETLTDEEKIAISGSVKRFYNEIYILLLVYGGYRDAIRRAKQMAASQNKTWRHISWFAIGLNGYFTLFRTFIYAVKKQGIFIALKRAAYGLRRLWAR